MQTGRAETEGYISLWCTLMMLVTCKLEGKQSSYISC